ncbi:caspase recruitment domain-containing protein 6 isoform X2 [Mesocricetus auratus]|uniref:Caspase recruitment domain-containing protein 6 isoform X2 n=1 Tax=Mesocricetus auratus TaxID=10036 RepID=A0ABM2YFI7_MESAU|nr:caspase recruitment domain-containing protein 6 isoform X2 [Mesocricetus auratus]
MRERPASQEAMATESASSEIIERQRTKLLNVLQQDPDSLLDTLTSRSLISEDEYEMLEEITDPLRKSRKLLIVVQKKGEESCRCFLKCLSNAFPEAAATLGLKHEVPQQATEAAGLLGMSRNAADPFSLRRNTPENEEIAELSEEKECVGWEWEVPGRSDDRETAGSSRESEHSLGRVESEVPMSITYLNDGQRYEELDDSLYLGEGEYQESVGHPEDVEDVEEGNFNDLECFVYDSEEDREYGEAMGLSNEESSYEGSESGISLEEEEKSTDDRKRVFHHILSCLSMDRSRKLLPEFVKQFSIDRGSEWTPSTPGDLAWNFLMKVQALDLTARDFILRPKMVDEESKGELLAGIENLEIGDKQTINPLDVLCASMLCSDSSLQREVMSNMYQCQFALPLLLPDAENNKSILMLGAMKDLKLYPAQSSGGPPRETETFLIPMKMPVISFVRLGRCSFSKSRILNTLLSSSQQKPHKIFLHQDPSVPVLPRQISGGLVEVTWCFPDNKKLKESRHVFQKPVAMANLRGDLESFWTQFGFLVEVSSAVFFFTDCLGEKEWDLLMFLGEDAIERCYFVLGSWAKEREETQIFQRLLRLKPSQLLFWEVEEAGDRREKMEALQAALQEVMSSSFRCVSLEDMASLARELGIQVDQDFEITQDIQDPPRMTDGENQQTHSQTKIPSESRAQVPVTEPGAQHEDSQSAQNPHQTPVFVPHPVHPWPLPTTLGSNFYHVSLKAPWVLNSHFGSQQRAKWFYLFPHQNARVHRGGKNFGNQHFQPWRFYSGQRSMKFSGPYRGYHSSGTFGRSQRQTSLVQTRPESLQAERTIQRPGTVVSPVGHSHSLGSKATKAAGNPQPVKACAQGMHLSDGTIKPTRTASHTKYPHSPSCQAAGAIQEGKIPVPHQGSQRMIKGRPSDPAFQAGSQSMSGSKLSSASQFCSLQPKFQVKHVKPEPIQPSQKKNPHPQPSQAKAPHPQPSQAKAPHPQPSQAKAPHPQPSQAKPPHPQPSQAKPPHPQPSQAKAPHPQPSQAKAPHPQPSQAKAPHPQPSQAKAPHPQPSQAKASPSRSTQSKPHRPHQSQSKPFQPRSTQHTSSQTKSSQAKTCYPRAGRR